MPPKGFKTAFELLEEERREEVVSTGVEELDAALSGEGLRPGTVYEIVGESSVGKSQLCFQICVNATNNRSRREVLYIDTEGSFRTERIVQIATDRDPLANVSGILERINLCRSTDAVELSSALNQATQIAEANPRIGLVVLDSIAFPIRVESESERRKTLIEEVSQQLLKFAFDLRCIVIVVNQVTTEVSGMTTSALGSSWSHRCTIRMWMVSDPHTGKSIHITKSPFDPLKQIYYKITAGGVSSIRPDCVQEAR
uniref:DNA repair protein RAD51 homolog 3 n=1 Tax=Steinernema glaseri TaxID=37863 RepID=A0A1I7Y7U7_9BILA